ncbi:efflux RND transporter periplasmic adaptor subunit [Thiohalorhabdus methylotrophus]|uniref:Efflux RND transporter periplasmic adaptor subunit n=1 Tax=Thiohalorhabdus methylotrophus TaxID=3242694 RepID=A0ABV4TVD7_9GAMM
MSSTLKSTLLLVIGVALGVGALYGVGVYQPTWLGLETGGAASGGKGSGGQAANRDDGGEEEREVLYWVAPMDDSYRRDKPGKSPMGMDLVPVYADEAAGKPGTVEISPEVVNNLGVKTAQAERRTLNRTLRTVGTVTYDERKVSHIHTRVEGWVEKLYLDAEGDRVSVDERILEIYSPELVTAQEEYLLALRRQQRLGGSGAVSPMEDMVRQARERLLFYGIAPEEIEELRRTGEIQRTVVLRAPHAGVVTRLGVREGMRVTPEKNLYTVADLSTVWVMADVYAYQAEWVAENDPVTLELPFYPGREWRGKVDYVYPYMDPDTRTVNARLVFDNPDGTLKPQMFAKAVIHADPQKDVIAVPRESVIRTGKREVVVTALGEGRFRPVKVKTGVESGEWVEIRKGLAAGQKVVTSGQFLLDAESDFGAAMERMDSGEKKKDMEGMDHGDTNRGRKDGSGDSMNHGDMDQESMEEDAGSPMDHEGHSMEEKTSLLGAPGLDGGGEPGKWGGKSKRRGQEAAPTGIPSQWGILDKGTARLAPDRAPKAAIPPVEEASGEHAPVTPPVGAASGRDAFRLNRSGALTRPIAVGSRRGREAAATKASSGWAILTKGMAQRDRDRVPAAAMPPVKAASEEHALVMPPVGAASGRDAFRFGIRESLGFSVAAGSRSHRGADAGPEAHS